MMYPLSAQTLLTKEQYGLQMFEAFQDWNDHDRRHGECFVFLLVLEPRHCTTHTFGTS